MAKELPQGMKPLKGKGDEYSDKVRSMHKGTKSQKASISAKIRCIKDMNPDKIDKHIYSLITNPEVSAAQIQKLIEKIIDKDLSDTNTIRLIDTITRKHSALFGTKTEIDIKKTTAEEVINRIEEAKKEEEDEKENR